MEKAKNTSQINASLIAPCGLNCALCYKFLTEKKNHCTGCLNGDENKALYCLNCKIKNCLQYSGETKINYCYECKDFPCKRLKQLDKRYRTKYGTSIIGNLKIIQKCGMDSFIQDERIKWKCLNCSGILSIHIAECIFCGMPNHLYPR